VSEEYKLDRVLTEEEDDREQLWTALGLPYMAQRNDVQQLMKAQARAELADLAPWATPGLALIKQHMAGLIREERRRLIDERARIDLALKRYAEGQWLLSDLILELREINGDDLDA
jgi:hypothetical protein